MEFPETLKYTKEHEWVRLEGDIAVVGVSEFAQEELGEIVFADLPEKGRTLAAGESFGVVESTKAASDVYSPLAGSVEAANAALEDAPDLINSSPYEDGWLIKLSGIDMAEYEGLMSVADYKTFLGDKI